ncbi:hypothetical protein MNV49_000338 [Pseudohyphozyma bogoriensis]|nr:hypothetical protein MNV49_000338 [Pseudohyphozyma bogoriensis]
MSSSPVRFAILGAAVYSRSSSTAQSLIEVATELLGKKPDLYSDDTKPLDELLAKKDVDAVIIAAPIPYQPALIKRAWAAGKHVASEKPVAGNVKDAEELIKLYKSDYEKKGIKWHVLENYVHESGILGARKLLKEGAIGKIRFFTYNVAFFVDQTNRFYQTEWRKVATHDGGFLLDGGVHHSATLRLTLPSPVVQISGFATLVNDFLAPHDTVQSVMKCADGALGTYELSFGSSKTNVREILHVTGSQGHLRLVSISDGARSSGYAVEVYTESGDTPSSRSEFESDGVENAVKYFVDSINGKGSRDGDERASPERALGDRITASYTALPNGEADWAKIVPEVARQLPLRNLHWKSASRSLRTIQSLDVQFKPLFAFEDPKAPPLSLLERPYLHLLFVLCDDNEVYRATLRNQIREWLDSIIARHKQEWLIVHVSAGKNAGSKFYQRKGSVVDKIRADFNTGKQDRCVQVAQFVSAEDPTAWAEFTTKVKEAVITTFNSNVALYEEDVRKADSQRQLEGWQYTSFFLQKEGLAECFEAMNLLEDALIQYDELEASFFQSLKGEVFDVFLPNMHTHALSIPENSQSQSWFSNIGGTAPGDDALPILSTSNKPYRKLLETNQISIFDFRIYLFARQAAMLVRLGKIAEVAKRGAYFISTFTRTLRDNQGKLGPNFIESWTFSACLNIVDECTRHASSSSVDRATSESFVAVKAELLELARKQLDKIGILSGHLPLLHPFTMSLNEHASDSPTNLTPTAPNSPAVVSRPDLLAVIHDAEAFDKLYIDLTNRSIQAYSASHRKRCSLKLHASLAALEDHRGRLASAQTLYLRLPAHYVDTRWVKIESALLSRSTNLQGHLDMTKERLLSSLALIRTGVEFGGKEWKLDTDEDEVELARRLMKDVYDLSKTLSKDFAAIAFPPFSMKLASEKGTTAVGEDGLNVRLLVQSLFPCALDIDEVRLKFSTAEGEQIWFTSGATTLVPKGFTEVTLFCPTAISGRVSLELSQIRFSRIIFQYSHRPVAPNNLAPDPRNLPITKKQPIVYFPRDPQALSIYTEPPQAIHLNEARTVIVCVGTGRNQLVKIMLKVTTPNRAVQLALNEATLVSGSGRLIPAVPGAEDCITIENLAAMSTVKIQVPWYGAPQDSTLELGIIAEYFTSRKPSTRRTFRKTVDYVVSLPLAVNVQDFFRQDCILSKFVVTTAPGGDSMRLKTATLQRGDDVVVKPCQNPGAPIITLLPLQAANFLFKIIPPDIKSPTPRHLRLSITYCSIQDEILAKVRRVVQSCVEAAKLGDDLQWFLEVAEKEVEAVTNLNVYSQDQELKHLFFDEPVWTARVGYQFPGAESVHIDALRRIYEELRDDTQTEEPNAWKALTILVEIPSLNVLNLVHMSPAFKRTEVGQALPVKMSIRPSFTWAQGEMPRSVALFYDVAASLDDWLISGRKKGEFEGQDGEEVEIVLVLVPLRPGSLFLPSVTIRATSPTSPWSCETQHLNAGVTVDVLPITSRTTFSIDLNLSRDRSLVDA